MGGDLLSMESVLKVEEVGAGEGGTDPMEEVLETRDDRFGESNTAPKDAQKPKDNNYTHVN